MQVPFWRSLAIIAMFICAVVSADRKRTVRGFRRHVVQRRRTVRIQGRKKIDSKSHPIVTGAKHPSIRG